jgi:hypothetical protein
MSTPADMPPTDVAGFTIDGDRVYVMIGGATDCEHHGRHEFITIGVRDSDSDDEVINRDEYRELINIDPPNAIRLARFLLDYATDTLDADDDDEGLS